MKINVIIALFGSATAIKVEGPVFPTNFQMPVVMLHNTCPRSKYPKKYTPPPSTLKCDSEKGYRASMIDVADGPCVYACNRLKECTVENYCLRNPWMHKECSTGRPAKWNWPPAKVCDSAKMQGGDYIESADGKSCEYGCNGPKVCTLENHCLRQPMLRKVCPSSKRPKKQAPYPTTKCTAPGSYWETVLSLDETTCDWGCQGHVNCTLENACFSLPIPSLYKTCMDPGHKWNPPSTLTCPAGQVVDYVVPSTGATKCDYKCNGYLPCKPGQAKTNTNGNAICDDTPLPATGGTMTAAAATVDATTLGAPAGTATVTFEFYKMPNMTAATQ